MAIKKAPIKMAKGGSSRKGTSPTEISKRFVAIKEGRLGPKAFMNFLMKRGLKIGKD